MTRSVNAKPGDHVLYRGRLVGIVGMAFTIPDREAFYRFHIRPDINLYTPAPVVASADALPDADTALLRLAYHCTENTGEATYRVWTLEGDGRALTLDDPKGVVQRSGGLLLPAIFEPGRLDFRIRVRSEGIDYPRSHAFTATCAAFGEEHGGSGAVPETAVSNLLHQLACYVMSPAARGAV